MGINIGAFLGITLAGWLAQKIDWHIGFAAAGVGMTLGLIQYVVGRQRLSPALARLAAPRRPPVDTGQVQHVWKSLRGFTTEERNRIAAVFVFFLFAALFWGGYEQAGSTLQPFADPYTPLHILGYLIPSSLLPSLQPIMVIALAPGLAWVLGGPRAPRGHQL